MPVTLLDLARPAAWSPWWAAVSLLVGLSACGFVIALPGRAFGLPRWQRASRLGLLLALAAGLAAPFSMLAALARPDRVWLLHTQSDGASWLATSIWLVPAYLAALVVFAWTTLRRDFGAAEGTGWLSRLHRVLAIGGGGAPGLRQVAMFAAGGLAIALMLAAAAELRLAWTSPLLPWHLALTALAGALGAVLVLDRVMPGKRDLATTVLLARIAAGVLALGMALGRESWDSPAIAAGGWAIVLALGWADRLGWLAGLLILAASWVVRWSLVSPGAEWGGDRLLAPLGMVGLLLVLLVAIAALAPVLGPRRVETQ